MNVKTVKYSAGSAVKAVWFGGKRHLQEFEYGPIWRVWDPWYGFVQTY